MATSILSPSLEPSTYLIIKGGNILSFTLGIILILVVLGHCYWKYRKQNSFFTMVIKTSFFALIFSFTPFITLSFLPQLFTKNLPVNPYYTGWFILLFPLSFTYLILAKRLYDIDVIVRRILFTMVIAIVPSVLLTLIYTILFRTEAAILTNVTVFLAALGVVTCILYSLEYLTNKFEPLMFPRKHNLKQAFKKMADKMSGIQSFQEIKEILLVDIHKTLEVEGVAIVLQFPDRMEVIVEGELDSEKIQKQLAFGGLDQEQFTVFPISRHEEYESRLIFTKKKNNTHLNKEEIDWLAPVLSNLAVSLENVYLIQKLTMRLHQLAGQIPNNGNTDDLLWLRKAMFEIQEKERYRIAIDIHDSTMQDIFLLKNRVDLLADRSSIPKEEKKELQSYVNHLEIINQNLRNNCFELNPHLLKEIGLVHTLDKWMESEVNEFEIEYTASFRELIESVDLDMKKHLFRISQELINNARKHSQATMVRLKLTVLDDQIWLTYKDNGKGFDMKRLSISERLKVHGNSGLGMEQLKSRVWLLKGRIRIYSKPGRGVRVHVRVPIDLNRLRIVQ